MNFDYKNSKVTFKDNKINLLIKDSNFVLDTKPYIESVPKFIFGNGTYHVDVSEMSMDNNYTLANNNGTFKFTWENATVNVTKDHFNFTLKEYSNDIFYLIGMLGNSTMNFFSKPFFEKKLIPALLKTVSETVNMVISAIPKEFVIPSTSINVFLDLLREIIIDNDLFQFSSNISAICKGKCNKPDVILDRPKEMIPKSDCKGLQFLVSDYMINSFLLAGYRGDSFVNISIKNMPLTGKDLGSIFPEVIGNYSESDTFVPNITMADKALLYMKSKESNFSTKLKIDFDHVEKENHTLAFSLIIGMGSIGYLNLENGLLKGNLSIKITFTTQKGEIEVNPANIQSTVNTLLNILLPQINFRLLEGISLKNITYIDFNNTFFSLEEKYMKIGISPKKLDDTKVVEFINWGSTKLVEIYDKLKAIKIKDEINAKRPIDLPKWIKTEYQ